MKIKEIKIDLLKPYKLNAKQHPEAQIKGIAESIKRFGFTQPLVVDKDNEIIIGHGRLEAAKLLGLSSIPCVQLDDLKPEEIKALRLIDNRIAETGWDSEMLKLDVDGFEFDFEPFNVDFYFMAEAAVSESDGAKELSEDDFNSFDTKCPKCNFEFNKD